MSVLDVLHGYRHPLRLSETSCRREVQAFRVSIGSVGRYGTAFAKCLYACGTVQILPASGSSQHIAIALNTIRLMLAATITSNRPIHSSLPSWSRSKKDPATVAQGGTVVRSDFIESAPPNPTALYIIHIALSAKAEFLAYACCHIRKSPAPFRMRGQERMS